MKPDGLPRHVRLYLRDCLTGIALGVAFAALLVVADVGGLGHLVTHVEGGWLAFAMLAFFNGIVFAGVQHAWTVWVSEPRRMEDEDR